MRRRILALAMAVLVAISALPTAAYAVAPKSTSEEFTDFENQFYISSTLKDWGAGPDTSDGDDWTGDSFYSVANNSIELGSFDITVLEQGQTPGTDIVRQAFQTIMAISKFKLDFSRSFFIEGELALGKLPDGLALGFQTDPHYKLVNSGGSLGYMYMPDTKKEGVPNGLFFEVDLYDNGATFGDNGLTLPHIAIMKSSGKGTGTTHINRLAGSSVDRSKFDGTFRPLEVRWDADTETLTVTYDVYTPLSVTIDPAAQFGADKTAYLTFTSAINYYYAYQPDSYRGPIKFRNLKLAYTDFVPDCETQYFVTREGQTVEITGLDGTGLSDYALAGETVTVRHTLINTLADADALQGDVRIPVMKLGGEAAVHVSGSLELNGTPVADQDIFNGHQTDENYRVVSVPFGRDSAPSVLEYQVAVPADYASTKDLETQVLCGTSGMTQTLFEATAAKIAAIPALTVPVKLELSGNAAKTEALTGPELFAGAVLTGHLFDDASASLPADFDDGLPGDKNSLYAELSYSVADDAAQDVTDSLTLADFGSYTVTVQIKDARTGLSVSKNIPLTITPPAEADVTFQVVNGTWNDGTNADKVVNVPFSNGKGTLDAGDVPTGMKASAGFAGGAWDVTPDTSVGAVTGDLTYCYTFAPIVHTITAEAGPGGAIDPAGSVTVAPGGAQSFTIRADSGYYISDVLVNGVSVGAVNAYSFDNVQADQTIKATFAYHNTSGGGGSTPTYYTLTFVSNGGAKIPAERHRANTTVELKHTTTWVGHEFLGWYSDVKLTQPVTSIKMTGDKTVYAKWSPASESIPEVLNGDDHVAYVVGREDGLVHPLDNITRAEVATIVFRLLKDEVRGDNLTTANSFTDVNPGDWYNTAISTMARMGVVKGRGEGIFDPNTSITRAEFAAMMARFDSTAYTGEDKFPDIRDSWARNEINRAALRGWVQGDNTGNFRPDDFITRAEAMAMVNRVLARLPESPDALLPGMKVWPDNADTSAWYYLDVQEATNSHDFTRLSGGAERWTKLISNRNWNELEK